MSNIKIRELAEEFAKINDLKFVDYFPDGDLQFIGKPSIESGWNGAKITQKYIRIYSGLGQNSGQSVWYSKISSDWVPFEKRPGHGNQWPMEMRNLLKEKVKDENLYYKTFGDTFKFLGKVFKFHSETVDQSITFMRTATKLLTTIDSANYDEPEEKRIAWAKGIHNDPNNSHTGDRGYEWDPNYKDFMHCKNNANKKVFGKDSDEK